MSTTPPATEPGRDERPESTPVLGAVTTVGNCTTPGCEPGSFLEPRLTGHERATIVRIVWPDQMTVYQMDQRCRDVNEIDLGRGTPTLSPKEREAIEAEIKRRKP